MNDFLEFHEQREDVKNNTVLKEEVVTVIAGVLGLVVGAQLIAFGLALFFQANAVTVKKLSIIIRKAMNNLKKSRDIISGKEKINTKMISQNNFAKQERRKLDKINDRYLDELKDLYEDIDNKNFDEARITFMELDPRVKNNLEVQRAIIAHITKVLREPPLYVKSPGNKTYQAIKKVINIKVAQASADAVKRALEKMSEQTKDSLDQ